MQILSDRFGANVIEQHLVCGRDDEGLGATAIQGLRQGAYNVGEPASLGIGTDLGGDNRNFHLLNFDAPAGWRNHPAIT